MGTLTRDRIATKIKQALEAAGMAIGLSAISDSPELVNPYPGTGHPW